MSSLYSHLKANCMDFLEEMTKEEIAEMIVANKLSFVEFRNIQIKKDYEKMIKEVTAKKMQIYSDLEELYCLKERAIYDVVKG